jgi:hypothetical protein
MNDSLVNTEVHKANEAVGKVCKRFRNLSLVDISGIRKQFTRRVKHLRQSGKQLISKIIHSKYCDQACTIPLRYTGGWETQ